MNLEGHDLAFLSAGAAIEELNGGGAVTAAGFHNELLLLIDELGLFDVGSGRNDEGDRFAILNDGNAPLSRLCLECLNLSRFAALSRGGILTAFDPRAVAEEE